MLLVQRRTLARRALRLPEDAGRRVEVDRRLRTLERQTREHVAKLANVARPGAFRKSLNRSIVNSALLVDVRQLEGRPAFGVRFATKLPNASNESGLGLDTMDFYFSGLVAKTVQSVRVVGNVGLGILSDPTVGNRQNDVLTYGVSFARALTQAAEIVGEINGRVSTRSGTPFPAAGS